MREVAWILVTGAVLLVSGTVAAGPEQPPAESKIGRSEAPQRFLDAFREGDEDTMRAIIRAPHLDPFQVADSILRSHVNGLLEEPPAPGDYLAAAVALAERSLETPQGAGLARLVAAWGTLNRPGLLRAQRLGRAHHAATAAYNRGEHASVLRIVSDAAADIREAEDLVTAAYLRLLEGLTYKRTSRFDEGEAALAAGAAVASSLRWKSGEAECLLHGSQCAYRLRDCRRTRDLNERARALYRELERPIDAARAETNLAHILSRTGEPARARALAMRLRAHYASAGDPLLSAQMLVALAGASAALGEHAKAAEFCEQAAAEFASLGDRESTAVAMAGMGGVLSDSGRHAAALRAYDLALDALGENGAAGLRAAIALGQGVIHRRLGRLADARRLQEQALALFEKAEDPVGVARARTNLAVLRLEQGEPAAAATLLEAQLAYLREVGRTAEAAQIASNLAIAYSGSGRLEEADAVGAVALAAFEAAGNEELAAHAERQLAEIALESEDLAKARRHADRALARFHEIGTANRLVTLAYRVRARIHLREDQPIQALETLGRAREIEKTLGHGLGEIDGLGLRSRARTTSDLGVVAASRVAAAEPERAGEALTAAYEFAEAGRGLLLAEQLANVDVLLARHLSPELLQSDALTRSDVEVARRALVRRMAQPGVGPDRIRDARRALDEAWARRRETIGRIQREARHVAELVYPKPARIEEVRRQLDTDTALVMVHVAHETAYALVVTDTGGRIHALGRSAGITDTVRRYLGLVASPRAPEARLAARLYARLIAPLHGEIEGRSRLVICPDGVLAFLPWAALCAERDGESMRLVERWETVLVPSATIFVALAREARREAHGEVLLALGNPAYPAGLFAPLPHSAEEVRAIGGLFPPARRKVLLGAGATLAALEAALDETKGRLRALHLACHAFVDDEHPRLSTLALAGGEMMDLDTVYRLRTPADLVVLSSCASARGGVVRGEGPLGFVRGFFFSGARRVVASNWKVSDDSTRVLMTRFYEGLVRDGLSPAAALRRAQLDRLRAGGDAAHPHHWAAFTLWGPLE